MSVPVPEIPSLSSAVPTEIRRAIDALRTWTAGIRKDGGIVTRNSIGDVVTLPPGLSDPSIPPRLQNFAAGGAFRTIVLSWSPVSYANFGLVEVWRSTVNDLGTAVKIGSTQAAVYVDSPSNASLSVTYYYWGRIISRSGLAGPFNATEGTPASTANDPGYLLEVLEDQITATQLHGDLNARINLIDAEGTGILDLLTNLDTTFGEAVLSQVASIVQEAQDRAAAVQAESEARVTAVLQEQQARAAALLMEAQDRGAAILAERQLWQDGDSSLASEIDTLTAAVDDVAAAVQTETGARVTNDNALAYQISMITAGVAGGFDSGEVFYFDADAEGFTASNATLSWIGGWIRVTGTGNNPLVVKGGLSVLGAQYSMIKLRIRRIAGTGWVGKARYSTSGHGFSDSYYKTALEPSYDATNTAILDFDMASLTAGGSDWAGATISGIELTLGATSSDTFEIDFVAIGRSAPAASVASVFNEATARANADEAEALSREALAATLLGSEGDASASGLIYNERQLRVTAEGALASDISDLYAELDAPGTGVKARISEVETATVTLEESIATANSEIRAEFAIVDQDLGEALLQQAVGVEQARRVNSAYIFAEREARATAEESIASQMSIMQAQVEANTSSIVEESNVRATADEVEAEARLALDAQINDPATGLPAAHAALLQESITRATAISAESEARLALAAEVASNQAALQQDYYTAVDTDSAISTAMQSAVATAGQNTATVLQSYSTTATMNNAIASGMDAAVAEANGYTAGLLESYSTTAETDGAIADAVSALVATINRTFRQATAPTNPSDGRPLVVDDLWFDTDNDNACYAWDGAGWVPNDDLRIAQNTAAIAVEQQVRALTSGPDWAADATYIMGKVVQFVVGGSVGLYQSLQNNNLNHLPTDPTWWRPVTANLYAQYMVKTDVNGKVAGFGFANDGLTSLFEVTADRFAIYAPPPAYQSGKTYSPGMRCSYGGTNWKNKATCTGVAPAESTNWTEITTNIPFVVDSEWGGAVMDTAFIKDATITNAMIYSLATDKLVAGTALIGNALIADAAITNLKIGSYIASLSFNGNTSDPFNFPGTTGWCISKFAGDAAFNNVRVRGDIEATSLKTGVAMIETANIKDLQVTGAKIASVTITDTNIANAAITNAKIANAAITNAKIANASVDTLQIAGNAVTVLAATYAGNVAVGTAVRDIVISPAVVLSQPASVSVTFSCWPNVSVWLGERYYLYLYRGVWNGSSWSWKLVFSAPTVAGMVINAQPFGFSFLDQGVPAGTFKWGLQAENFASGTIYGPYLSVVAAKR